MHFMNKTYTEALRKRSQLQNQFQKKNRSPVNRINYIKKCNYCLSLFRKIKK